MWEKAFNLYDEKTPLHWAAAIGHLEATNQIIAEHNIYLNAQDTYGWTPLHYAVAKRNIAIIETLLEHGAKTNLLNQDGQSPIHMAVVERNIDALEALIANGANLYHLDHKCRSPIYTSIKHGYGDIVSLLIPHIDINNNYQKNGYTPLHSAIHHHKLYIAKFLLECGANINAVCTRRSATPLQYAICNMIPDAIDLLLENGANPNIPDIERWTPLHVAIDANHSYAIKALLKQGAETDFRDNEGQAPVHRAVLSRASKAITYLTHYNADLNALNKHGETALYISVRQRSSKMLRALIRHDADVNIKIGSNESTALHLAVYSQSIRAISILLDNGANVNAQDINGDTPLHIAASMAEPSLVHLLLQSTQINPFILNHNNQTALILCMERDSSCQILHKQMEYKQALEDSSTYVEVSLDSNKYPQYRDNSDDKEISK